MWKRDAFWEESRRRLEKGGEEWSKEIVPSVPGRQGAGDYLDSTPISLALRGVDEVG